MRVNQLLPIKYWDGNYSVKSKYVLKAGVVRSSASTKLMYKVKTAKLCDETHLPTHKGAQKNRGRRRSPHNTLLDYSKVHQKGWLAHQKPVFRNQRSTGVHNGKWELRLRTLEEHPVQAPPRVLSTEQQPHCPGMESIMKSHQKPSWDNHSDLVT